MEASTQHYTFVDEILEGLTENGLAGLKGLVETLLNGVMRVERDIVLQAKSHERTPDRQGYANGYKPKALLTRCGTLDLKVPQTRGLLFYPKCLEKGARAERALKLTIV